MIASILARYKDPIENAIASDIESFGPKTVLRDAIEYSLKQSGKRFRPAIVYMIAQALGKKNEEVIHAALAIEYFHTASLIADDLPCMDDDDERREMPAVHKAFGEATAILATYALIAAGYDHIRLGAQQLKRDTICSLAIECTSANTGILGAAGGQYDDLYTKILNEADVLDVIDKKTGALFEISFVFGWLYGGGELSLLEEVKQAARSFGRAFQISDDFLDLQQDKQKPTYLAIVGVEKASSFLSAELDNYYSALKKLSLETKELLALGHFVESRIATFSSPGGA